MPATLTFLCDASAGRFAPLLRRAAQSWNDVLHDLVRLREGMPGEDLNIRVVMDDATHPIRTAQAPTRVARCQRIGEDTWQITLSRDVTWATTAWSRFWGRGENALTCLIHELGHVFGLPHSSHFDHVMHPMIGGSGKLSTREKAHYRAHFLSLLEEET
jgi:hypothetical protein